ncbi:MAG TPA: zinc ribbon domain-containing protein [Gammaproteobacteria bacterium]|nr:zinc ribbon domain-containing protein [Xanthomonadales bacterium]MCB1594616.1 zinc ribbon domain-containing protein [Xanthomonadales bacterium]HOP21451.1 zinc ribbon domain-containing protein [Gammaproteobacteria bacterium]HPI94639.1 zinc ribbon domain-containing protein [Gammaproteobacteria bacterium]HPQ86084.1 zinc ribbon domain-containing protein [Gammaproteobacteria bacterium]
MPFYTYQNATEESCEYCRLGFEVLQRLNAEPVQLCPECGNKVKKVISVPNVTMGTKHLTTDKKAEEKGFTKYKRAGKGVYEKTAGKGPKYISSD